MRESSTPKSSWTSSPMLSALTHTAIHTMKGGASIPTLLGIATPLNHLVSQHQRVVSSRGSLSRLDKGQLHSSSLTSLGRGNRFSSLNVSMPSHQQLHLQIII
ncbi:unnamed protein product [Linum trigynum]|uniref:Uncharacterized protein n=1 Tax=Linum trigynum TaxID=586398 RepID=A0AAV2DCT6_9ROSI